MAFRVRFKVNFNQNIKMQCDWDDDEGVSEFSGTITNFVATIA